MTKKKNVVPKKSHNETIIFGTPSLKWSEHAFLFTFYTFKWIRCFLVIVKYVCPRFWLLLFHTRVYNTYAHTQNNGTQQERCFFWERVNARDTYPKLTEIMLARDSQRARTEFVFFFFFFMFFTFIPRICHDVCVCVCARNAWIFVHLYIHSGWLCAVFIRIIRFLCCLFCTELFSLISSLFHSMWCCYIVIG